MSRYISDLAVAEYDRDVKQEYTQKPQLRSLVKTKTGVQGSTCRFHKSAQGAATKKIAQADVTPMNIDYSTVTATLEDWNAPEYTDIFSAPKVNFDERAELVSLSAAAIGRREDQIILDAIEAGDGTLTTAHGSVGMTTAKFRDAKRQLDYYSADGDRAFVMASESLYDMLGDSDADNFDQNAVKALVSGEMSHWLGFRIYTVGYMAEGGLAKATYYRENYAFCKSAIGYAIGMDMHSEINYVAQKTSWLVNSMFSAAGCVIDAYGVCTVSTKEAASV